MVLTQGIGRFITVAYAKGDDAEVGKICSTMFPILLTAGILLLGIGWTGAWYIDKLLYIAPEYVADAQFMMALLVFSAALRVVLSVFGSGFLVSQKLMLQDMIDVGCQLLRFIILFSLLLGVSTQVLWVVVAMVIAEIVNLTISTVVSLRLVPAQKIRFRGFHSYIAKEITSYGGWGFINHVADTVKQSFDPLILNKFASAVDVSVFYVGGIAARQLRLMLTPFSRPFLPILAAMYATEDFIKLRNTYLRATRYHSWLILVIAVPAIIFSNEAMHLYLDGKYDEAGLIMAILISVTVLNTFNSLGPAVVAAAGEMREMSLRYIAIHTFNLILTIILVVYLNFGALGAATATLIAVVLLEVTFMWPFCRKVAHTPFYLWFSEVIVPSLGLAIPSIIFCLIIKNSVQIESWGTLMLVSFISATIYIVLIGVFGLRQQDRIDIGRIAERSSEPVKTMLNYFSRI